MHSAFDEVGEDRDIARAVAVHLVSRTTLRIVVCATSVSSIHKVRPIAAFCVQLSPWQNALYPYCHRLKIVDVKMLKYCRPEEGYFNSTILVNLVPKKYALQRTRTGLDSIILTVLDALTLHVHF